MVVVMLCTWVMATIPAFVHAFAIQPNLDKQLTERYYITANSILFTFMTTVFIMIGATYKEIQTSLSKRHVLQISSISTMAAKIRAQKVMENRRKVARIFLFMLLVYFVTIIPQIFGSIVIDSIFSNENHKDIKRLSKPSFHLVYVVSSVINPVLTVVCKPDYKKTIFKAFRKSEGHGQLGSNSMVGRKNKVMCLR